MSAATDLLAPSAPRPLYLVPKDRVQVRCNGEFLFVQQRGREARHYAVRHLDRVVCSHLVAWEGDAMTLCLRHGVTVSWLDSHSQLLGHCTPTVADTHPLHACLERFVESTSAEQRWDNWFRHRRMHVLSAYAARRQAGGDEIPEREWRELKRQFIYWRQVPLQLHPDLLGPFQAMLVARLARERVQTTYLCRGGQVLDLLDDLTVLVWGELNLESRGLGVVIADRRIQWQFVESWQREHPGVLSDHLDAMKFFIARTLQTCL